MEEGVDVKALRARFHDQASMAAVGGGGGPPRSLLPGVGRAGSPMAFNLPVNGAVRPKMSPVSPKPLPGVRLPSDLRFPGPPLADPRGPASVRNQPPLGVFPRPPPSHRAGSQEFKMAAPVAERPGNVKATGELLQNMMLKQVPVQDRPGPKQPPPSTLGLRSQRSMTEVPPLRRTLPPEGPRPIKPKRPPVVNLDGFRKAPRFSTMPRHPTPGKIHGGSSPALPGSGSPSGPPRLPARLSVRTPQPSAVIDDNDDQDTYDDIDVLPPPPPPPPKHPGSRDDSWPDHGSTRGNEESDESEIYEPIDEPEGPPNPIKKKDLKTQLELKNKEEKLKQKKEIEYRKRFKLTDPVEVLHIARVRHDWQGGKNDLSVQQGDNVEIIRIKNNPEGKWLARTPNGTYGYISNTCVDLDYEAVKRSFLCKKAEAPHPPPPPPVPDDDFYDDVGSSQHSIELDSEEVYDDVQVPDEFPPPPPEASLDPKKAKKQEKEEKEFRKKFKFEGPINVIWNMMVDPNASIKKGGGKDLSLNRGEILEVIQFTNDKKALCRNLQGKYGYVPRSVLLQAEGDIYDDVDNQVVYDNDTSTSPGPEDSRY
ncbi:hypothetical protein COCON_G00057420 [Conger conger]|uniref:SH3 domain-containing protein n=1 Tax=Conger conger TaxID=82655 RepID=A0A9Q1I340_CONCO|nr:hypothetical protein COCON_G00057420 [Conger conger]